MGSERIGYEEPHSHIGVQPGLRTKENDWAARKFSRCRGLWSVDTDPRPAVCPAHQQYPDRVNPNPAEGFGGRRA